MVTEQLPITNVFPNIGQLAGKGLPKNPRFIKDEKYRKLVQSIKDDPEMMELRELIVYDTGSDELGYVVVGGNMRYRAMKELGYKEVPCKVLHTGFPMDKLRRIVLKDNSSFGDNDLELLIVDWSRDEIELAAIDLPDITLPDDVEQDAQTDTLPAEHQQTEEQVTESHQSTQRLDSTGEIDVTQFETKQTLSLQFTPDEYMFVLDRLREFGDDYPQSLLLILGYGSQEGDNLDF